MVGDIMLDRSIRREAEHRGYAETLNGFQALFANSDLLIGNLEGPITNHPSVNQTAPVGHPDNTRFTFSPRSVEFLTAYDFDLVSIGNNHITDFGRSGVSQTRRHLAEAGVEFIGDPFQEVTVRTLERQGLSLSFISYNQFLAPDRSTVVSAIQEAGKTSDWLVVYAHWGEEYANQPNALQRETARRFIDAGADLVVGSHPHTVQPIEEYKEGLIFYSLGNFVFDQYWNEAVRCGLVATVTLSPQEITAVSTTTAYMDRDRVTYHRSCRTSVDQTTLKQ